jgi:hypothetical protein
MINKYNPMSSTTYLVASILAGFLLLTYHPERSIEAFRELRFPMRSQPPLTIQSSDLEQVVSDPHGVVLDQGAQAIRVGASDIILYTNHNEAARLTSDGRLLIGEPEAIIPVNSVGQPDRLTVKGGIVLTGSKVLEPEPSSVTAYFYDQALGEYYDYGGIKIMDRSYDSGNSIYYLGEWIQLQASAPVMLKSFSLRVAATHPSRSVSLPNIIHLLGSSEGSKWYLMKSLTNQAAQFTGDLITFSLTNTKPYLYYRVVFTQMTGSTTTQLGPYLQLYTLAFTDIHDNPLPPGPMQSNSQAFGTITYTLSSSITTGNIASVVDGDIQSIDASLTGLTRNVIGGSVNQDTFTVMTFPFNNDYYLPSGNSWSSSGLAATLAMITTTPFNSGIGVYASYHGSYPIECMRVVHNGGTGMVGIGVTQPQSNLSVLGSFETSYMSCDVTGTKFAINRTSSNYIEGKSGIVTSGGSSLGYSQILFHSSDSLGTGTNNFYDTSIVSYGGVENQNNKGTLSLNGDLIQLSGALNVLRGNVGIGTTTPSSIFQIYTGTNLPGLNHTNGVGSIVSLLTSQYAMLGSTSPHNLVLMAGNTMNFTVTTAGRVGVGTMNPAETIHCVGNHLVQSGSLFVGQNSINDCMRMVRTGTANYLDYAGDFYIRSNQALGFEQPRYYTPLTISKLGYVGIGTTAAGRPTAGGTVAIGLEIYNTRDRAASLLRLVNTFTTQTEPVDKGAAIEFANTYGASHVVQSLICGRSANGVGSKGLIDFWLKVSNTGSDASDLRATATVTEDGLFSGNTAFAHPYRLSVGNSLGQMMCGVAAVNGHFSGDARSGDSIVRTLAEDKNLLLQSGGGAAGLCIENATVSSNIYDKQSRVGVGTTTPLGLFSVYRKPQLILSSYTSPQNLVDQYLMYVSGGTITNQKGGTSIQAPHIALEAPDVYSPTGATAKGGKIMIRGGLNESNGAARHGLIEFYTGMTGATTPVVTIGNPSYNTAKTQTYFGLNMNYMSTATNTISSYAIYAEGAVVSTSSFISTSDERIKKNILPVETDKALELARKIRVCEYEMRDYADPGRKIGVIAQQVREVFPEAVSQGDAKWVANINTRVYRVIHDQGMCMIQLEAPAECVGRMRMVNSQGEWVEVEVLRQMAPDVYHIDVMLDGGKKWLVYGTKEENILMVDKPAIGMVTLAAVQELASTVDRLTEENGLLKKDLDYLKEENLELRKILNEIRERIK